MATKETTILLCVSQGFPSFFLVYYFLSYFGQFEKVFLDFTRSRYNLK